MSRIILIIIINFLVLSNINAGENEELDNLFNQLKTNDPEKALKTEGKINWKESAKKILAKINGLNPNPGAWFEYNQERYKIWKAEIVNKNNDPGKTLDNKLTIACGEQSIKILEIQKEGKNRQLTEQFLLGNEIKEGVSII